MCTVQMKIKWYKIIEMKLLRNGIKWKKKEMNENYRKTLQIKRKK